MDTFADRIIFFNTHLKFDEKLPRGIQVMNPFQEEYPLKLSTAFYRKYYSDNKERFLILGINPGRFGAGFTGVPFTDTKRLVSDCEIEYEGPVTHEPSSVFVYEVIEAMGGPEVFYKNFFIQSISPLGFTIRNEKGRDVNYNYYDSKKLEKAALPFITDCMYKTMDLGVHREIVFCFGTGKNLQFVERFNEKHQLFREIIPLEHPRFIMQYRSKYKKDYIDKYVNSFAYAMSTVENSEEP